MLEPEYDFEADRTVAFSTKKYTRHEAYRRFAEIAEKENLMLYEYRELPRHYVFKCLYIRSPIGKD